MDGRAAGVSGRRPEHAELFAAQFDLPFIKKAQQLQREVFEGQRRPVEELQDVGFVRDLLQRGHIRRFKAAIRLRGELMPLRQRDLRREQTKKLRRELWICQRGPRRELVRDAGQLLRQKQAAIRRETGFDGFGEGVQGRLAAGGKVAHGWFEGLFYRSLAPRQIKSAFWAAGGVLAA